MKSIDGRCDEIKIDDRGWVPQINLRLCQGCGDCVAACPACALGQRDGKAYVVSAEACSYCGICETICPTGAIALPYEIVVAGD